MELPSELTEKADLRGQEYAWRPHDFSSVAEQARTFGYGCLGGQFQFRVPGGVTCEMYWLNADPDERAPGESWPEYSNRSCSQTLERFKHVMSSTDFLAEACRWRDVPMLAEGTAESVDYLYFVAYFIDEPSMFSRSFKPNPYMGGA